MNSFETDLKRAFINIKFLTGVLVQLLILCKTGMESDLFRVSIPVVVTLPYSTAWITDYTSGFIKEYLPRCGKLSYIAGKFLACGISGGSICSLSFLIYQNTTYGKDAKISLLLLFLSGMLWACAAVTLAAISNSRYIAYGGSFVIFYVLVIVYERYFPGLYCLYPVEWYHPKHVWILGDTGIVLMCVGMILILFLVFFETVRRRIDHG